MAGRTRTTRDRTPTYWHRMSAVCPTMAVAGALSYTITLVNNQVLGSGIDTRITLRRAFVRVLGFAAATAARMLVELFFGLYIRSPGEAQVDASYSIAGTLAASREADLLAHTRKVIAWPTANQDVGFEVDLNGNVMRKLEGNEALVLVASMTGPGLTAASLVAGTIVTTDVVASLLVSRTRS